MGGAQRATPTAPITAPRVPDDLTPLAEEAPLSRSRVLDCSLAEAELPGATLADVALHGSDLTGVRSAEALRGVVIRHDQVLPLALAVFGTLGITVGDDPRADPWRAGLSGVSASRR
ncbi:MAG TPA: hypothetical protein VIL48_12875 [Acidimicrobiales bacterium]